MASISTIVSLECHQYQPLYQPLRQPLRQPLYRWNIIQPLRFYHTKRFAKCLPVQALGHQTIGLFRWGIQAVQRFF